MRLMFNRACGVWPTPVFYLQRPVVFAENFDCHTKSVAKSLNKRANVALPLDVVAAVDQLVGKRGRSAFRAEVAQREVNLRRQRQALKEAAGSWKDEDHRNWPRVRRRGFARCAPSTLSDSRISKTAAPKS
jgi:hypothetical protein